MTPRIYKRDVTEHCVIPDALKPVIASVFEVYVYDQDEATHCCEITPSRWLIFCYCGFKETKAYDPDKHSEACTDLMMEFDHCTEAGIYMHCHHVDAHSEPLTGFPADATIDDVQEYERCNPTY